MKKFLLLVAISSSAAYGMGITPEAVIAFQAFVNPDAPRMTPAEISRRVESANSLFNLMMTASKCRNCSSGACQQSGGNNIHEVRCLACGLVRKWKKSEQGFVAIEQDEVVQSTAPAASSTREQVSAAINPGNSGGPLMDNQGEVIGINTSGILETQIEE